MGKIWYPLFEYISKSQRPPPFKKRGSNYDYTFDMLEREKLKIRFVFDLIHY